MNCYIDKENETLDDLMCGIHIIQPKSKFRFSIDAVLLSHFTTIKNDDLVIDFCSGSGIVAFLLCAHTKLKKITCIEIQSSFCEMIERSIGRNNLEDKIFVVCDNINNSYKILGYESVDVITCNPPYLKVETGRNSTDTSFNVSRREVKTNLEEVIQSASKVLKNKGRFALVHLANRAEDVFFLMKKYNLHVKRARLVQPNINAKPNLLLVEGVKNAKESIDWLPTLNVYKNTEYTDEIKEMYGLN